MGEVASIEMSNNPVRPSRPKAQSASLSTHGTLMQGSVATPSLSMVSPGPAPSNAVVNPLQKFAQLILYGIAMVAIWGGILAIAFSDNSTNLNFLILGIGGIVSAIMAIALVEWQRTKGGDELHSVHDYLIGIGFFFSAVGVLWGSRWLIGFAASNDVSWLINESVPYSDTDWYPSANAIYVQLVACLLLMVGQVWYLGRLKGQTTFGWSIATFTPLVLALIGFGPWMRWSGDIVSWELGISIIALSAFAMMLSLRSNSGMIFAIVSIFCGIIPILYEFQNEPVDDSGLGGALSLMVFIIVVQGWLAADNRLRQDLMQWTSIFLVGEVLIAMFLARAQELNLILGPLRGENLGELSTILTLQVVLWLTVLVAYFPATLKRRIPYMPIGLAASLFLITPQASIIPWILTIIMLPYMVIISEVTRKWVANCTIIAAGASFFLQSYLSSEGFYYDNFDTLLIIALLVTGEIGRLKGKIDDYAHFSLLGLLVLSSPVLLGSGAIVPWAIVIYTISSSYMMLGQVQKNPEENSALGATLALFTSMLLSVVLSYAGRLEVPLPESLMDSLSGLNITLAIVGIMVYVSMIKFKETELDLGYLISMGNTNRKKLVPVFDPLTGNWIIPQVVEEESGEEEEEEFLGWGPLSRISLIGPLLLFSIAVSSIDVESIALQIQWIVLMLIPIGIIIKEVLDEKEASSVGRMIAIWLMVIVAAPVSLKLNLAALEVDQLIINGILFDLFLLSGPLIVSAMLTKKGINKDSLDESADIGTLVGLLALGFIDSSGGLLFITMYFLVFSRSLKHRQNGLLAFAPIALIMYQSRFAWDSSVIYSLLQLIDISSYDPSAVTVLGMTRLSCIILASTSLFVLGKGVIEGRGGLKENQIETPMVMPSIWLAIGLAGMLSEVGWLFVVLTILLSLYSWLSGRIELIPWSPIFMFFSILIGISSSSTFTDLPEGEIVSNSFLFAGIFTLILNQMASKELLYRWSPEVNLESTKADPIMDLSSVEGRIQMENYTRILGIICLTLSWSTIYGIGTFIGAIWITRETFSSGQKYALLALPLLYSFAVGNLISQLDIISQSLQNTIVGLILVAGGISMTYLASKTEIVWSWELFEWDDEAEYFAWVDRVGMIAIAYFLIGVGWIISFSEIANGAEEITLFSIWAAYLIGIAIQGFREETETPWRRGFGSFGSLFSIFMLSLSIDTELFRYVLWMLLGIVAFGFGILYMNRMGEGTMVFEAQADTQETQYAIPQPNYIQEPVEAIEEPMEQPTEAIEEPMEQPAEQNDDEFESELEKTFEEVEDETVVEEEPKKLPAAKPVVRTPEQPAAIPSTALPPLFDVKLDPTVMAVILQRIAMTPHIGFRPVVNVQKNGNINLTFEKI
jgi:hypothetical protein